MKTNSRMLEVLGAAGRSPEIPEEADIYGWLAGDWEADVVQYDIGDAPVCLRGEWHFAWVLEGRAMQDVWIVPPVAERSPASSRLGNRYGTTLRVYDANIEAWRITWINPVNGAHTSMVGRRRGNDIVQEATAPDGSSMRWSFVDITPDSCRWLGEQSYDGGKTWHLWAEFFLRRLAPQSRR